MTALRAILALGSATILLVAAMRAEAAAPLTDERGVNQGVVELETLGAAGASVQIGEDLANLIDDGATRRVLPVVGKGSMQNIVDLKALRGIDIAVLQIDVLDYVKQQKLVPGSDAFTYIAKLYNEEFHLLARRDIKSITNLANQKVNVDIPGAGSGITAQRLFGLLNIPIKPTNDDQGTAIQKLRAGEIAAIAYVAGKPAPLFQGIDGKDGLHLLAIPQTPQVLGAFAPSLLQAEDYPGLVPPDQPVETIAVGTALAAAKLSVGSKRYRNLANFVDAFFTGFKTLTEPGHHPKWREVNLAATVPGWQRFAPADNWLRRNAPMAKAVSPEDLKAMFMRFVEERQQAAGGVVLSQQDKDQLFSQFERWQKERTR